MFRHKNTPDSPETAVDKSALENKSEDTKPLKEKKEATVSDLRELLEKNLKWSQIIYEQNRKINSKLFWTAVANWIRVLLIAVPLILAVIFLPPLLKKALSGYSELLGGGTGTSEKKINPSTIEQFLKMLPLNSIQEEQIKAMLK